MKWKERRKDVRISLLTLDGHVTLVSTLAMVLRAGNTRKGGGPPVKGWEAPGMRRN